jgi:hypothetical protein
MARGQPDYDNPDLTVAVNKTDTGFLFPSLNGFSPVDSRGRIIWFDDFRNGLTRWIKESDAGGGTPYHYYADGFANGYNGSVLFDPIVNGGLSGMYIQNIVEFSKIMGIEVALYMPTNSGRPRVTFQVARDGGSSYTTYFVINPTTGAIAVSISGGEQTITTPSNIDHIRNRWISIKLVADFDSGKLVRLFVGNNLFDISAYSMAAGVSGYKGYLLSEITADATSATNKQPVYLGNVIITGDEP